MVNNTLQLVDLLSSDGKLATGLVAVRGNEKANLSIDEQAAIKYAEIFESIDYVFFRRFSDGRSSQLLAYVVDNSNEKLDERQLSQLHLEVWIHGAVPLLYVAWPTKIDLLTCAGGGPHFWENVDCHYEPAETFGAFDLESTIDINRKLRSNSASRLANGTFWDEPANGKLANYSNTAHQLLIQAVVDADNELNGKTKPVLRRLLLLMVLVKYLEDRDVFPEEFFYNYHAGANKFFDVLKGGNSQEVCRLLDFLEEKFNGDIFSLSNVERQALDNSTLVHFANLVEGKTIGRQRSLWNQFSFKYLPVEIISNLYQRFVEGGHGTVYTPPFLASLLLDYAMPYETLKGQERILDPACGSGIFLVGAFKRLINVWRNNNDWKRPNVEILKRILKQSIFGSEVDQMLFT